MRMNPGGRSHVDFTTITAGGAPLDPPIESKIPLITRSASKIIDRVAATITIVLFDRFTGREPSSTCYRD